MGVHNLWELLAPVGRRVSVETLSGKKLAIDASIWIVQFMKAMRDEKGEMVRNAHLIGFFRRICKLLFLRTKPVFVFDGGTPALKRRTVIARRRQRENAQTKIRKTAEKLLMNQLKTMKLKQLAEDIKNQRKESDTKGKKVLSDQTEVVRNISEKNDAVSGSYNQEKLDEMLAASLAAEEDGTFTGSASTSATGIPLEEEEDDDEDEEMILPTMHGKVDPAVLAALPPSMQLDLLVQMRERLMAENRQKYQKVKKAPSKFSELQIQSYLKTVAFRREIDEVRKSAAGRGVGGVQTSRIASESNREYIFSSSFTGDKQVLTSAGAERSGNKQHQTRSECPSGSSETIPPSAKTSTASGSSETIPPSAKTSTASGSSDTVSPSVMTSTASGFVEDETGRVLENDVETYMDDRGHLRVSRVRAMGIRMTRDLQRNLDLMKELEQERSHSVKVANSEASSRNDIGVPRSSPNKYQFPGTSSGAHDETVTNINQQSISKIEASIEISFEEDGEHKFPDGDDDLFARLVAGDPIIISSVDNTSLREQSPGSASESDWEDGFVEDKVTGLTNDVKPETTVSVWDVEGNISNGSEVELEEGVCDVPKSASPRPAEYGEAISRGCQEEETEMQEAIRRSLEDLKGNKCVDASSENQNRKMSGEMAHEYPGPKLQSDSFIQQNEPLCETLTGVDKQDGVIGTNMPMIINASGSQLASSITSKCDDMASMVGKSCERYSGSHVNLQEETQEIVLSSEKLGDASSDVGEVSTIANCCHVNGPCVSDSVLNNVPDAILVDACKDGSKAGQETAGLVVPAGEYSTKQAPSYLDVEQKLAEEIDHNSFFVEKEHSQSEVTEATLEEEMLVLDQEFINLGDEQRKNERNAESVSSEMFAECQELLQMFGLPYIIAPMEAEAQCAYMELANLVDGVVTDDSDAFLFGARSVYKNIFDERKYVETYFMKDIENELGLSRDKLIRMALLLGSDYTEGISGIGIVNAIEVVNAFPEEDGFHKFREWIESPDPNIFGKFHVQTGSSSRKQGPSVNENDTSRSDGKVEGVSASEHNQVHENEPSMDCIEEIKQIFMNKHRNVSKNWHIPSSFPSEAVISAYASPQVDKSTEPFAWGKPDLFVLRKLCWGKFGWGSQKADDLLLPVLKEYNKHETQLRLEAFYTFNERFAKVRSKRIKKAVKGITGNESSKGQDGSVQADSKTRKRKRVSPIVPGVNKSEKLLRGTNNDDARKESNSKKTLSHTQSEEGEISAKQTPSIEGKAQPPKRAVDRGSSRDGSSGNRRNRGRGRRQQVGRGGRKGSLVFDSGKSSSSDDNSSNNEQEVHIEKLEEPREVRRSTRSRKPVDYKANDLEFDDADKTLDQGDEEAVDKQAADQELSPLQGLSRDAPVGLIDMNQHNFGDPLLEMGLSKNHCDIGSKLWMDEDEIGELSVSHSEDPSLEAAYSKDYLKMGGGFCMDEDETDKALEQANDPAAATTAENTDCYHGSDSVDETEHDNHLIESVNVPEEALNGLQDGGRTEESTLHNHDFPNATTNDVSNSVGPTQENIKDHTSTTSVRALSAMPFLRRKRRQS